MAWTAVPPAAPGSADCTYSIDNYIINTTSWIGSDATHVATATATASPIVVPNATSFTVYSNNIYANGTAGLSAPRTVWESTPPWPVRNLIVADYVPADPIQPGHLRLDWDLPLHIPARAVAGAVEVEYYEVEGPAGTPVAGTVNRLATPGHSIDLGPYQPADWKCYEAVACAKYPPDNPGAGDNYEVCANYGDAVPQACGEIHAIPNAVDDLRGVSSVGSVTLTWTAPDSKTSRGIVDYQINWTSPFGEPNIPVAKAPGNATTYTVTHLPLQTGSSLRVAAETYHTERAGVNITGATILNVQPSIDFVAGTLDLTNETRDLPRRGPHIDMEYTRSGADVVVEMAWPATAADALNCEVDVPATGRNYTAGVLPQGAADADGMYHSNLTLGQIGARIADVDCEGGAVRTTSGGERIPAVAGDLQIEPDPAGAGIPLLEWIASFRSGEWGTQATIGAFDLVTLIVIIVAMIGFNRSSPAMGLIFSIIVLGVAAYFELIELPGVILGVLALLVMIAVIITRRGRQEVVD